MKLVTKTDVVDPDAIVEAVGTYNGSYRAYGKRGYTKDVLFTNTQGHCRLYVNASVLCPGNDFAETLVREGYIESLGYVFILEDCSKGKRLRVYRKGPKKAKKNPETIEAGFIDVW